MHLQRLHANNANINTNTNTNINTNISFNTNTMAAVPAALPAKPQKKFAAGTFYPFEASYRQKGR